MSSYTAKKWTPEEVNKAVELFKKGKDYKYISEKVEGRSAFAIQCKLESYVYEKINEGSNYKQLGKQLDKPEEELKKMFESQMKRNQERNGGAGKTTNSPTTFTQYQASPNTAYGLVNRILTPYIEYNTNLEKLESLKTNKTISSSTYKEIKKILDTLNIDDEKFLAQLKTTVETKRINPIKSDSKTSESDDSSESESEEEKEKEKEPTITLRKRLF
jgi:hypothetical protein